jgi:hypothetical protein
MILFEPYHFYMLIVVGGFPLVDAEFCAILSISENYYIAFFPEWPKIGPKERGGPIEEFLDG